MGMGMDRQAGRQAGRQTTNHFSDQPWRHVRAGFAQLGQKL